MMGDTEGMKLGTPKDKPIWLDTLNDASVKKCNSLFHCLSFPTFTDLAFLPSSPKIIKVSGLFHGVKWVPDNIFPQRKYF